MKPFVPNSPWYAAGLAFECRQCGGCCAGPDEGYVWVTDEEIAAIAAHLHVPESEVRGTYVYRVARQMSLKEHPRTKDCVFLTTTPAADGAGTCECGNGGEGAGKCSDIASATGNSTDTAKGGGRRTCSIYSVRPAQCRTWPFWNSNLESPQSWGLAGMRCPGVNRGQIVPFDEIENRRQRRSV